jgi:Glycosyltransferase sugar-binding region containing DXD motif
MIPNIAHFIWIGEKLPYIYTIAIKSACIAGKFSTVKLHGNSELLKEPHVASLQNLKNFKFCNLDPKKVIESCNLPGFYEKYIQLVQPAGKANLLRLAILFKEGGVYLDTDTITLKPMESLLENEAFAGEEYIIKPYWVARSNSTLEHTKKHCRNIGRKICVYIPHGYLLFEYISKFYLRAVNNAVLGAEPAAPLLKTMLNKIIEVPQEQLLIRFKLGTHLLQETLHENPHMATIQEPDLFYPLSPEICRHFFKNYGISQINRIISDKTKVVHWYASVKTKNIVKNITADYIKKHSSKQIFSHLALPFI